MSKINFSRASLTPLGRVFKIYKKGVGINFVFSGNNDSDIIPKTYRYHTEGRDLVKMSVLKGYWMQNHAESAQVLDLSSLQSSFYLWQFIASNES